MKRSITWIPGLWIWPMKVVLQSHGEIQNRDIETRPVLLMNYQWSREQKWNRVRGKHSVYMHFPPKDPTCDICLKTKTTRASCRICAGTVGPKAEIFGELITADHKTLSEESESRNNHRRAVEGYKIWQRSGGCKSTRAKQKLLRRPRRT